MPTSRGWCLPHLRSVATGLVRSYIWLRLRPSPRSRRSTLVGEVAAGQVAEVVPEVVGVAHLVAAPAEEVAGAAPGVLAAPEAVGGKADQLAVAAPVEKVDQLAGAEYAVEEWSLPRTMRPSIPRRPLSRRFPMLRLISSSSI